MLGLRMAMSVPWDSLRKRVKAVAKRYRSSSQRRSVKVRAMKLPRALADVEAASSCEVCVGRSLVEVCVLCGSLCAMGADLDAIMPKTTMSVSSRAGGKLKSGALMERKRSEIRTGVLPSMVRLRNVCGRMRRDRFVEEYPSKSEGSPDAAPTGVLGREESSDSEIEACREDLSKMLVLETEAADFGRTKASLVIVEEAVVWRPFRPPEIVLLRCTKPPAGLLDALTISSRLKSRCSAVAGVCFLAFHSSSSEALLKASISSC